MKRILNILLLGLILIALISIILVVKSHVKESIEEPKTAFVGTVTKDLSIINFNVTYKGNCPEYYSDYAIKCIVAQTILKKNVFELLKQNSLEFLEDTLEYEITPIDPTFKVLSIETEYYLRREIQELWDEYVNTKIEAAKIEEKAKNLEILYGE